MQWAMSDSSKVCCKKQLSQLQFWIKSKWLNNWHIREHWNSLELEKQSNWRAQLVKCQNVQSAYPGTIGSELLRWNKTKLFHESLPDEKAVVFSGHGDVERSPPPNQRQFQCVSVSQRGKDNSQSQFGRCAGPREVCKRWFSAYFPPEMVPHHCYKLKHGTHLPFFCPHVYRFRLFSGYVPLIFRLFSASRLAGPLLLST